MDINAETLESYYRTLKKDTEDGGYRLNPDVEMTRDLIRGLMVNENRYGYPNCPCRLTSGTKEGDLDIICPCDYRDPDLTEYGCCYCGLYVSQEVFEGKRKARSIPERRPAKEKRMEKKNGDFTLDANVKLAYPVWRCAVCGYLCARDNPPEICPVCKAKKERFSRFL